VLREKGLTGFDVVEGVGHAIDVSEEGFVVDVYDRNDLV